MRKVGVPVSVCVNRFEEAISRDIFYIITPDLGSDVATCAASMQMKVDAVALGGEPYANWLGSRENMKILRDQFVPKVETGKYQNLTHKSKL